MDMQLHKQTITFLIVVGLVAGGCSSSKPVTDAVTSPEDDFPKEEQVTAPEASTDPVPVGEVEQPASPEIAQSDIPTPPAATPEPEPQATLSSSDYTVQVGDTLMKIAFETYGDLYQWKKIYEENKEKISNPNAITPGIVLKLESPSTAVSIDRNGDKYLIKRGDTLGTISEDVYGTKTKWRKIFENNKQLIHDPNRIFAGFYLYYTMTQEERDAAEKLKQGSSAPAPLAQNDSQPTTSTDSKLTAELAPAPATIKSAPTFSSLTGGETSRAPASDVSAESAPTAEAAAEK